MNTKQLALEALRLHQGPYGAFRDETNAAIAALEADLAQPVEPVGYVYSDSSNPNQAVKCAAIDRRLPNGTPLYTAPQEPAGWQPIETAPKDGTPVDLWRGGERLTNMRRVEIAPDNVFYEPAESGYSCVRDATHWAPLPSAPKDAS